MKKIILYILLIPLFMHAQTIPGSSFPVIGSTYIFSNADTTGIQPGSGGTGQVWDYSALTPNGTTQVIDFMSPSATPYGGTFPTADIATHEVSFGSDYYVYFNNDGSEYQRLGNVQPDVVIYQNPPNQYPYPIGYGNMFNDTYYSSYTTTGGGNLVHMSGNLTIDADGSGTLMLPTGTFGGVLRIKSTRDEHDTIFGTPTITYHMVITYYDWFQTMLYFPILSIVITDMYPGIGPSYHIKTVGYRSSTVGIHEASNSANPVIVGPNPSSTGIFHLTFNDIQLQIKTIEVTDVTGRVIFTSSGNIKDINLGNSENGCYFYHVQTADGNSFSGKIMKN